MTENVVQHEKIWLCTHKFETHFLDQSMYKQGFVTKFPPFLQLLIGDLM